MSIKRIIIATGNAGKAREVKESLEGLNIPVFTIKELGIESDPEETGTTFVENALIKARAIKPPKEGDAIMSDDSGLEVDFLGGRPGVYSARYLGEETSYNEKMNGILDELKGVKESERTARFKSAIALILSDGKEFVTEGVMEGVIANEQRGSNGFGYDPIFIIDKYGKTGGEVSSDEKNAISHRGQAIQKMRKIIEENM